MTSPHLNSQKGWAVLFLRLLLGLTFFMAGYFKTFSLGPVSHAETFFVSAFSETWIPTWLLWVLGTTIPIVEFVCGVLLLIGFKVRQTLIGLGILLVVVTYGHLLQQPLFSLQDHIFPRAAMLVALLLLPLTADRMSLDGVLARRGRSPSKPNGG